MSVGQIQRVVRAFADAADRAKKADSTAFRCIRDGYQISEYLSPYYNRRTDEYGGNAPDAPDFFLK
jgi:2,4-dienoyl-CoA reductase-like NADH-dependent reductase (Old Yellow Enzyme family)